MKKNIIAGFILGILFFTACSSGIKDDGLLPTLTVVPARGSCINTITSITITYSEHVTGASVVDNYEIRGPGVGTLVLESVTEENKYTFILNFTGTADNGDVFVELKEITDKPGNPLSGNTIYYSVDTINPTVSSTPGTGSAVTSLDSIDVLFSRDVLNADAVDNYILAGSGKGTLAVESVSNVSDNTYRVTFTGTPANGPVTITINDVEDTFGNPLSGNMISLVYDTEGPGQTAEPVSTSVINELNEVTVSFTESVTGADDAGNYILSGDGKGSLGLASVEYLSNNTYRLSFTGDPVNGTVNIDMSNIQDLLGNSLSDTSISYSVDLDNPLISSVPSENSRISSLGQIEVTYSKGVSNAEEINNYILSGAGAYELTISDVSLVGENTYSLAISGTLKDGPVTLTINDVVDSAGNGLSGNQVHLIVDIQKPEAVSIPSSGSYVNSLPSLDITYNEDVQGAENIAHYSISGTGAGDLAVSSIINVTGNTYRLNLSGTPVEGTVTFNFTDITDSAGNSLNTSSVSLKVEFENPTVEAVPASGSGIRNLSSMELTFSEAVEGADSPSNYSISGSGSGTLAVDSVRLLSGNTYRVFFSGDPVDGDIDIELENVADSSGNSLNGSVISYSCDNTDPSQVSIEADGSHLTSVSTVDITFSEPVVNADDISSYSTNWLGANEMLVDSVVHLTGSSYRLVLSGGEGRQGSLVISMASIRDLQDNHLSNSTITYVIDTDNPTKTADPASGSMLNSLDHVNVTYSEAVTGGDTADNYSLSGAGVGTLSISSVSHVSGNTYQLTLTGAPAEDEFTISIANICDLAGLPLNGTVISYCGDYTDPGISQFFPGNNALDVPVDVIVQTVFSEPVVSSTIDSSSFIVNDGTNPIDGTLTVRGRHVFFKPDGNLPAASTINVEVTTSVTDLAGNQLPAVQNYSFTTKGGQGAAPVADISGSSSSYPLELTLSGDTLFFTAYTSQTGRELYSTDLDTGFTTMVRDIYSTNYSDGPESLTDVNGTLFFSAREYLVNGWELWRSDGTSGGTYEVRDINEGSGSADPDNLTVMNGKLYFTADNPSVHYRSDELYSSDGTYAGTGIVRQLVVSTSFAWRAGPRLLTPANSILYFVAGQNDDARALWRSDGTLAGTWKVKDIIPENMAFCSSLLYFKADDGTNGSELWTSNGSGSGTLMIKDINPDGDSSPDMFTEAGGTVFFTVKKDTDKIELWKTDGTEGTTVPVYLFPSEPDDVELDNLIEYNGSLYFSSKSSSGSSYLWKSNGTAEGTEKVKDIEASNIIVADSMLYMIADTEEFGLEIWQSDGTEEGTFLLTDINDGVTDGIRGDELVSYEGDLYFVSTGWGLGIELWHCEKY